MVKKNRTVFVEPMLDIKSAATLCELAYEKDIDHGHERIIRENSTALFLDREFDKIFAIAGTNDLPDLWSSFKKCYSDKPGLGVKVHMGYFLHAVKLRRAIINRVSRTDHLILTGHSLGGVAAQIISLELADQARTIQVITFGAPKAFKTPFNLPPNVSWINFSNLLDLIPYCPITNRFRSGYMEDLNYGRYQHSVLGDGGLSISYFKLFLYYALQVGKIVGFMDKVKENHSIQKYWKNLDYYQKRYGELESLHAQKETLQRTDSRDASDRAD